jgi:acyl carrier protein
MGLDTVEIVMAVEDHFQIEIPDDIAATLETVGLLHRFVVSELQRRSLLRVDEAAVFAELKAIICDHAGVTPDEVVPEAYFIRDLHLD